MRQRVRVVLCTQEESVHVPVVRPSLPVLQEVDDGPVEPGPLDGDPPRRPLGRAVGLPPPRQRPLPVGAGAKL